jgi:tripartite-type tricarboxylate transporter receptor subunit TctC
MKLGRREFLYLAAGAAALAALSPIDGARAQSYPIRPITMIVPAAAGSSTDTIGRIIAERMRRSLAQPIIIENVGGADGSVGAGRAARAKPDGYTIDLGYLGNHVLNGAVYSLQYDVLNDFAPISPVATASVFSLCQKDHTGKGPERTHCLAQGKSQQGVDGSRGSGPASSTNGFVGKPGRHMHSCRIAVMPPHCRTSRPAISTYFLPAQIPG